MTQHSQYTNDASRKAGAPARTRLAAALITAAAVALGFTPGVQAQTVLPVPFVSNIAGIAPGGSSTACSSSVDIPTFAFSPGPVHYGDGCVPNQATLLTPYSTTIDSLGNIYIADYGHFAMRVIYNGGAALSAAIVAANPFVTNLVPQVGRIYTIAGGSRTGTIAKTGSPTAYYCNSAGTGPFGLDSNGSNCPGAEIYTKVRTPALDKDGNVFFSSTSGGGQAVHVFCVQCAAGSALFNLLALEIPGTAPQPGFVYEIAGASTNGYNGDGALAKNAALYSIRDVVVDANENVYISDGASTPTASNNNIRVIYAGNGPIGGLINVPNPTAGFIYTLAGGVGCAQGGTSGCPGTSGTLPGSAVAIGEAGPATSATFNSPYALFLDANANVYVADYSNARIREIYQGAGTVLGVSIPRNGYIYTVAGGGTTPATSVSASGTLATQLAFGIVSVASTDPAGNIYLFDGTNRYIWRVDHVTGIGTIIAGLGPTGVAPTSGNFCSGTAGPKSVDTNADGCPSTQVAASSSGQYSFDPQGNFYETESASAVVRKYSLNTQFSATAVGTPVTQPLAFLNVASAASYTAENFTLQGGATTEFSDAGSDTCTLNSTIAANTTCVFNVKFSPAQAGLRAGSIAFTGSVASDFLSGVGQAPDASIDPGTQTTIGTGLKPNGVGTDLLGNLYISDATTNTVKKVPAAGGTPVTLISGLSSPAQIAVDGKGNVYVADTGNNRIAMTSAAGGTITALGTGLSAPTGVAVDGLGNVYVADTGNNRVVKIFAIGGQKTLTLTGAVTPVPARLALDAAGDLFVVDTANSDVVELAVNASQATVNLGTSVFLPSSVAVDAAGDLYVTDATNKQVVEYLAGSTSGSPLITGLATPVGIAADVNGSVYVADTGLSFAPASITEYLVTSNIVTIIANNNFIAGMSITFSGLAGASFLNGQTLTVLTTGLTGSQFQVAFTHANTGGADAGTATPQTLVGVIAINRTLATVNFPYTNLGQPSLAPITFTDTGNLPLNFTGAQFATATGATTQFSLASASANGCVLGVPFAAGTNCLLTANFAPTPVGVYSETISPVTNAANNSSLSGALSGQGVQLITTTTTLSSTPPASSTINYGQPVTVSSTTTLASTNGTPVGTITFTLDSTPKTPISYGTGTATLALSNPIPAVGAHSVSVSVVFNPIAGVPVYGSSGNSLNFTVLKALTTTKLAIAPTQGAITTTLTATVMPTTGAGETGTVNFYSGTTLLNVVPQPISGGVATFTAGVSFPSNSFTAVYSGDTNFAGSTSVAVQPTGDFNLSEGSSIVSIPQGGNVTNTILVTPYFGYVGTVTPSCTSGVPQYAICRFQPVSAAVMNGASLPATITAYSVSSAGIVTLTAANNFVAGESVSFTGLSVATFLNYQTLTVLSTGLSSTQFQILTAQTTPASGVDSGTATPVTQVSFTVELYTSTNLTSQNRDGAANERMAWAMLSPIGLAALLFAGRRRVLGRNALLALVLMLSLAGVAGLSGCTNAVPVAPGGTTPASINTVTVTFTDSNTPQVSHSIPFTLKVCNFNVTTTCQTN